MKNTDKATSGSCSPDQDSAQVKALREQGYDGRKAISIAGLNSGDKKSKDSVKK